jgi:hypothetical protein
VPFHLAFSFGEIDINLLSCWMHNLQSYFCPFVPSTAEFSGWRGKTFETFCRECMKFYLRNLLSKLLLLMDV